MQTFLLLLLLFLPLNAQTLDVPFVKQQSEYCGPAALSSVFRYYGLDISQEKIGEKVHIPSLKGALISDLENYARNLGFKTESGQGDIGKLKKFLDRGIPVIVLVDYGKWIFSRPHYLVVVGYNKKGFVVHDGYRAYVEIPYRKFKKLWKKSGNVYLAVYR
ncbi:cysteine peptidase family C39 domain-containing protein [Persephonella sp.]